jgi:hypothetical protein
MKPSELKKYATRFTDCWKRECFVPFSGNGRKICRLYELGQYRGKSIFDKEEKHESNT